MKHLVFVIWVLGWWVAVDLSILLMVKYKDMMKIVQWSKSEYDTNVWFHIIVWVAVAILLWFNGA